jgi:hypothetical protein
MSPAQHESSLLHHALELTEVPISRRGLLRGALGAAAAAVGARALGALFEPRTPVALAAAASNVVIQWNNAALQAIRDTHYGPPMVARALAILHTCIYDAWTPYDPIARPTQPNNVPKLAHGSAAIKAQSISYAAYRALVDLFPQPSERPLFDNLLASLGYDPNDTANTNTHTPSGKGNVCAQAVLDFRHTDGSNQLGDLHPGAYSDYTGYVPVNPSTQINDPNQWQALRPAGATADQTYIAPFWGNVIPFALTSETQFPPPSGQPETTPTPYYGPGVTPGPGCVSQAQQILAYSAGLTDTQKVIAEYWADGPNSELPPGHFNLFAQFVSARDGHTLDDDVKMFFALTNAVLDASIACWGAKRLYNSVRPITAIHYLWGRGGPFAGQQVRAWAGPYLGTQLIDGGTWLPYQPLTVVTPPFPEYYSGHSTFSAAGAEILKRFTGSDTFGDSFTQQAGTSRVEPRTYDGNGTIVQAGTPASDVTLSWATFSEAADQAGLSRRYGGIHFIEGDLAGRAIGRLVAGQAWDKAQAYITGSSG